MNYGKLILIFLLTTALLLITFTGLDLYYFAHHGNRQPATTIVIESGSSVKTITKNLQKNDLIGSGLRFSLLNRILGSSAGLKAGEYRIKTDATPLEIINTLRKGVSMNHKVSFPEGFTVKQIIARLQRLKICKSTDLEDLNRPDNLKKWQIPADSLEGYLFPSTYFYQQKSQCSDIITQMIETAQKKYTEIAAASPETNLNRHQILTLASIIQKEAGNIDEMPLIAAVFHNRLKRKMRLASDPTTIYGLGKRFDGNLHRRDLKDPSPYNTYQHKGLPPGPICNPGSRAIQAALNPAASDFLFFVSRNNGTHQFSKTFKEHQRAVRKYQLKR